MPCEGDQTAFGGGDAGGPGALPVNGHAATGRHRLNALRALRHRDFRLFWFGQIVSQTGSWVQIVAQGWLVYQLTESPLMLGLVGVVGLVPVVPVSLIAGAWSDRFPRRKLIMLTEATLLCQAIAMGVLTWLGIIRVWHVIALTFVLGVAAAIEQPARLAFIVDITGREDLTNALALNASLYSVARIAGPAIAGIVVARLGVAECFLINALSYLAFLSALLAIRAGARAAVGPRVPVARSIAAGFRFIWTNRAVRGLMAIVATASLFISPVVGLMPVLAQDLLQAGPEGLGFLMTGVGIGAIAGALAVGNVRPGSRGRWLTFANILAPLLLAVLAGLSRSIPAGFAILILYGAGSAARNTLANSLIQTTSPAQYRGRVAGIYSLLFSGMSQVGVLGVGALAEIVGVGWALGVGAALGLTFALIAARRMPHVYALP
jgi:MFS family permease